MKKAVIITLAMVLALVGISEAQYSGGDGLKVISGVITGVITHNYLEFPSRIYQMERIALRDAVNINTGHVDEIVNVSGSARTITSATDAGDGLIRIVLSDPHTFLVGEKVLIAGTNKYDGEHNVVARVSRTEFDITAGWDGTATGTVREVDDEIVYSPLDGLPVVKCIARAGEHSRFTFVFSEMLTLISKHGLCPP